ncbi:MAG: glycosyltransferase 87 family protein [Candidatus Bathyarchaeia archaeon]
MKKKSFIFFAAYLASILIIYVFPVGLDSEWYSFYRYLDEQKILPYIDVREGYPPIGFLVYMPLYWLSNRNPYTFNHYFRLFNGLALTSVLIIFYALLREEVGERKALKYTLAYSVLPSVIISNTYSNDVVALLFAASAMYMMVKGRPRICGLLIGLATLSKGFPALLMLPTLIRFENIKAKIESIGVFILTLLFVSLPFLALNPLAYISTFTHHGSRGPWETIWAIIDGYYSHGGFLHPYFDKFFYHGNLASIYTPNRYDHAFYLWKYDWLPNLLTLGQVLIITVFMLAYAKRPDEAMKLCGLIYLAYMLFFKGYSTQFAVSTSFYFLLAGGYLALLIPLEISHAIQIISWTYIPQINLRNMHTHLLLSSILIRTIIFTYVLISSLRGRFSDLRETPTIIKRFLIVVKRILSNRRTLMLAAFTIILGYMFVIQVFSHLHQENIFRSISGSIDLSVNKWENVTLSGLERGDKIIVKLYTNTRVETYVIPGVAIERGVRNQYNLRGSFNETILFFRATAEQHTLSFKMAHPKLPFRITDGFNGDLKVTIEGDGTLLKISLVDEGLDGKDSFFRIAYPYESYVEDNFRLNIKYEVVAPNSTMPTIILDLFDETDEWLYAFKITEENFTLTPETPDINGYTNLKGDMMSLVALSIVVKDSEKASLTLRNLSINDQMVALSTEDAEIVNYEVYIEKAFKMPAYLTIGLFLLVSLITYTILLVMKYV